MVAPNQKVLFLCNCCSTILVPSLKAQLVAQRRQNGGGTIAKVAQGLQWSLSGRHWSAQRCEQWPTIVHPFCDHGDVCVFLLPPLSDPWATDLLGDCFEHAQNFTATMASMAMLNVLCTPLNDQGNRSASFLPSTATWSVLWSYKEAQRSQPLCKGGIIT